MTMIVRGYGGEDIDTSGMTWIVGERTIQFESIANADPLDFAPSPLLTALRAYIRHCCSRMGDSSVHGYHHVIQKLLRSDVIRDAIFSGREDLLSVVTDRCGQEWRMEADHTILTHVNSFRRWYVWSTDRGYEGFDEDVAALMETQSVGNARLGTAVLRRDAGGGPLSRSESAAVEAALWLEIEEETRPLSQVAAILLLKHLGVNIENLRRMNEKDLTNEFGEDGCRILKVPRIKKGFAGKREDFQRRELDPILVEVLENLIAENALRYPPDQTIVDAEPPSKSANAKTKSIDDEPDVGLTGRPMFWNPDPEAANRRVTREWFAKPLRDIAHERELETDAFRPLRLFPRRFRYTFAAQRVEEGVSAEELRDLLDHCSTAVLLVYFHGRLDVVERIDEAIGTRLEPFARVAMGLAPRPAATVPFPSRLDEAPRTCFGCGKYVPVDAGPITQVADRLEQDIRARQVAGEIDAETKAELTRCDRFVAAARRAAAAAAAVAEGWE